MDEGHRGPAGPRAGGGYLLAAMERERNGPESFRHELSAFSSAARSVLQDARKESDNRPGDFSWYNDQMKKYPQAKFMKGQRDSNLPSAPVPLNNDVAVASSSMVMMTGSATAVLKRSDGTIGGITNQCSGRWRHTLPVAAMDWCGALAAGV